MLSRNAHTIEQHMNIVGSRFQLAQIIMHRTKELMSGAPINGFVAKVGSEFNPDKRSEIPNHRFPKIALEELRQGKLTWKNTSAHTPENVPLIEENPIIFGE